MILYTIKTYTSSVTHDTKSDLMEGGSKFYLTLVSHWPLLVLHPYWQYLSFLN